MTAMPIVIAIAISAEYHHFAGITPANFVMFRGPGVALIGARVIVVMAPISGV
jgi:hypothetical protein